MSWHHARCQGLQTFSLYSVLESVCGGQLIPTRNQGCSVALEPARPSSAGQCEALPKLPNCQRQHIWSLKQARAGGLTLQKMANPGTWHMMPTQWTPKPASLPGKHSVHSRAISSPFLPPEVASVSVCHASHPSFKFDDFVPLCSVCKWYAGSCPRALSD